MQPAPGVGSRAQPLRAEARFPNPRTQGRR
jgi:hypothetical protein